MKAGAVSLKAEASNQCLLILLQVALQQTYQSYHDADPEHHTPPIPTAQVR